MAVALINGSQPRHWCGYGAGSGRNTATAWSSTTAPAHAGRGRGRDHRRGRWRSRGGQGRCHRASDVAAMVEDIQSEMGGVDVLVHKRVDARLT